MQKTKTRKTQHTQTETRRGRVQLKKVTTALRKRELMKEKLFYTERSQTESECPVKHTKQRRMSPNFA